MAEGLVRCGALAMGDGPSSSPFQDESVITLGQVGAREPSHAESEVVFSPSPKGRQLPADKASSSSPGVKFLYTASTSPQTQSQLRSCCDQSVSGVCETCFYCPECSDKSD